jgi:mono/diheme cytochrome c family protein
MFTVPTGYNFHDPACKGVDYICWPTVGTSGVEYYASQGKGIPGWDRVLLVTTLKRGSLYVLPLSADGKAAAGHFSRYFQSENRYRDTAVSPDGRTIYIATDSSGLAEALAGGATSTMQNPGAILSFTYVREGAAPSPSPQPVSAASQTNVSAQPGVIRDGTTASMPPQFTAAQAAAGKTSFNANFAVCHGNTLTNGTFAPPLAGEYFKGAWSGRTVRALYDKARTMPPAAPASLPDDTYANIAAYIFEVNGFAAGDANLPAGADALDKMTIK